MLELDLATPGSVLLVGGPASGRTSALATLAAVAAARLAPAALELYVIDTGALGRLVHGLPQLASRISATDPASIGTLLSRLRSATEQRPRGAGALLLLIDDWDAVLDAGDDAERAEWADTLAGLLRSGPRAGLTIVTAGGRTLLAARTSAAYDARWLLPLVDPADYPLAGVPARTVPSALPPGRGIRAADGAHFQLADPRDLPALVRAAIDRWAAGLRPDPLVRVRPLPGTLSRTELPVDGALALGVIGDAARPFALDLAAGVRLVVVGPPRSGRSTVLRLLAAEAARVGWPVVLAAPPGSPLASGPGSARLVVPGDAAADVGAPPESPTLLLVDDSEQFTDGEAGEALREWLRVPESRLSVAVVGRSDDLATTYRGLAADVRRTHRGVLLRPSVVDGELLGVRLDRRAVGGPPGRGVVVGPAWWGVEFAAGGAVPVQIAQPVESMCG